MKTLLIDNYDSYTYNLFQILARINGEPPTVISNDELKWEELVLEDFDNVVISPGPGHPARAEDFGICARVLREATIPVLGVCLGHQGMAEVFGGSVIHAPEAIHGRRSGVKHANSDVFAGIPQGFRVVRYHSLVVDPDTLPEELEQTAWTEDGIIMGLKHKARPMWGVQFHPESIDTEYGVKILENFAQLTREYGAVEVKATTEVTSEDILRPSSNWKVHARKLKQWHEPEQIFAQFYAEKEYAFWLDSSRAEPGMARFSFIGSGDGPNGRIVRYSLANQTLEIEQQGVKTVHQESIFTYLEREIANLYTESSLPFDFNSGFCGYFGYELKAESCGDLAHQSDLPDACFMLADRMIVFDHETGEVYLLELLPNGELASGWFDEMEGAFAQMLPLEQLVINHDGASEVEFELFRNHTQYTADIERIQKEIIDGETYEITLTNEMRIQTGLEPLYLYRHLRRRNPAPYAAYLSLGDVHVLSSSPERFLKVEQDRTVTAKPIKGTIKRGESMEEDRALLEELRDSEKNRAENLMIVDLLRNDLGTLCEIGSVHVPKLMAVETYETVHQLVSTVAGKLRSDVSVSELVRSAFAGGSMTGAPKKRSMQIIDEVEGRPRGIYSGSIGFLALNGSADLNIVIRTIIQRAEELSIGVGGAITILSDAEDEYEEMLLKAEALVEAIRQAESALVK